MTSPHNLQRDWVNNWPRDWPEFSYPSRLGWQAGVNRALGADAQHTSEAPAHSPYDEGTGDHDAWRCARISGEAFARQQLAQ